jgi:calcineurin-like phosphoesterase
MPHHLSVGKGRPVFNAILVDVEESSGRAIDIERIIRQLERP